MDWIELRLPPLGVLFRERFIAGCWYGLFASFSSDMVKVFLLMSYAFRNESGLVYLSLKNKGFTILLA